MVTILSSVVQLCEAAPEAPFAIFRGPEGKREVLTRSALDREANRVAAQVARAGVGRGHVLIMLPQGPTLMAAFLGAMRAGAVPSIFPINPDRVGIERLREGMHAALTAADAKLLITDTDTVDAFFSEGCPAALLTCDDWREESGIFEAATTDADDVAFVQHSSGTTGQKKGVAISHRALLAQVESYGARLGLNEDDVIASWLPLYHDMGFVACFMMPLVTGVPVVTLDPFEWVSDPVSLLRAISDEGATLCWMPNFAYLLMAKRVKEQDLHGISLSSLRALINCSEPVTDKAHQAFAGRFCDVGLRPQAFAACYAMAENTFAVTQTQIGVTPATLRVERDALQLRSKVIDSVSDTHSRLLVSSGAVVEGCEVRLMDTEGVSVAERQVGEIILRSEFMLDGYFQRPDLTTAAIKDGFYHTGDLGFMSAGELFVTGRKKDLIIVAGRNIHPEDVESIASEVPGVRGGRAVAFGVYDEELGTDTLVILAEREKNTRVSDSEIRRALGRRVAEDLGVTARQVVLVESESLIKSTSGKMSRSRCKARWQEGGYLSTPPPAMASAAEAPDSQPPAKEVELNDALKGQAFGFQHLVPVILLAELSVQLLSVALPAWLLWIASSSLWTIIPAAVGAYYLYCFGVILLSGLLVKITPKPSLGQAGHRDKLLYALNTAFYLFVDRGPGRWHAWVAPFPSYPFLTLCGAKITPDLVLAASLDSLPDPFLVEIGQGTILGKGCIASGHWVPRVDELHLGRVVIGKNVLVGRNASIWPDVTIGDNAVICEGTSVMPGTTIGAGETWGGIPARRLDGGGSKARPAQRQRSVEVDNAPEAMALVLGTISELSGAEVQTPDTGICLQRTGLIDSLRFLELIEELNAMTGASIDSGGDQYRSLTLDDLAEAVLRASTHPPIESTDRVLESTGRPVAKGELHV